MLLIAAIRGRAAAFALQRAVSTMVRDLGGDYWTSTVYTTNRRVWEHDEALKERLGALHGDRHGNGDSLPAGFGNRIQSGALPLVSDQPMVPEGVKTEASDARMSAEYVERHIQIGIEALRLIRRYGAPLAGRRLSAVRGYRRVLAREWFGGGAEFDRRVRRTLPRGALGLGPRASSMIGWREPTAR